MKIGQSPSLGEAREIIKLVDIKFHHSLKFRCFARSASVYVQLEGCGQLYATLRPRTSRSDGYALEFWSCVNLAQILSSYF